MIPIINYWQISRVVCQSCRIVRAVVKKPDAEIRCPHCGGPVQDASGLDDLDA